MAGDASEHIRHLARVPALGKYRHALRVTGTAADKLHVMNITVHDIERNILRTNAFRRIFNVFKHNYILSFC